MAQTIASNDLFILGLDISSFRIDGGLIRPKGFDVSHEMLGTPKDKLVVRVREVRRAVEKLSWGRGDIARYYPDWIVIEDAYGASGRARKALDMVAGAITSSAPSPTHVVLLKAVEWRKALGAKNTKIAGHEAVRAELALGENEYDEHELDALGVALGWAAILKSKTEENE